MTRARARSVVLLVVMLLPAACDGRPTSPTAPPLTAPPPGPFAFEMTGVVTNDQGRPVPGARVAIWNDMQDDVVSVLTDESGRYTLNFNAAGTIHYPKFDPVGTEEAVAFGRVEAAGYELYGRFVLGPGQHLVENVRLRRIERIKSGESAVLSIAPDDSVCDMSVWPGRELICRTLRVVVPRDGTMKIEAVPSQAGSRVPTLYVWGGRTAAPRGNPTAIEVSAGEEYTVRVELPRPFSNSQSFVVKTLM